MYWQQLHGVWDLFQMSTPEGFDETELAIS